VWREFEFALPRELTDEQNLALAQEFAEDYIAKRGIPVVIHAHFDVDRKTRERKPHIHATMSTRTFEEYGLNPIKEVAWNNRNLIQDLRVDLCNLTNFHLKLHGHRARVDHRSYAERGIDLLPQPKLRKGVFEMEKRAGFKHRLDSPEALFYRFKTRIGQDWQDKKIQNLVKVMMRPQTVIETVASAQSTFVWRDIKQEVARYVPDTSMASYLCSKVHDSSALVNVGEHHFFEGTKEAQSVPVFTSRETLEKEADLGLLGKRLAQRQRHEVSQEAFDHHVDQADQDLKEKHKTGLSKDQKAALAHICSAEDLSCW
ncbi:putative conjugal transfer protein TraA, partial [Stylophora pistillata]